MKEISQGKRYLLLSIILFGILHLLTPVRGHNWDLYCWSEWAKYIYSNGLGNVYKFWTDYLPLYHYFLWVFGLFQNNTEKFMDHIHYMKMVPLLFQLVSGYLVLLLIQKEQVLKHA
ncbi:MAG: hypothetical protein JNL60_17485, partial [Bacteroidia bacterium]|nr:hypothetical protein [Bacteroidia bacterium]